MAPEEWVFALLRPYKVDDMFIEPVARELSQAMLDAFRAAVAEEREACAKVAEGKKNLAYNTTDPWNVGIDFAVAAIRARGQ